jgi:hypothetical protein
MLKLLALVFSVPLFFVNISTSQAQTTTPIPECDSTFKGNGKVFVKNAKIYPFRKPPT